MNNSSQFNNLGDQIKGALNEALSTGDFKNLNNLVSDTVKTVLKDAEVTSKTWKETQTTITYSSDYKKPQGGTGRQENRPARQVHVQKMETVAQPDRQVSEAQRYYQRTGLLVKVENVGLVAGVLFIVFGAIANIPLFILSLIGLANGWSSVGALLFFLGLSIFFICVGKSKIQLINKAKRYVKLCGNKMYAEVEVLATQVGISPRKVVKELRKILQKGIIPSAHLDKKGTNLMLNDVIYKQYLEAEKTRLIAQKDEKEKAKTPIELVTEAKTQQKTELEQMIAEGRDYIRKLRDMNDLIPGEVISAKLYRLEGLLKEIFERLQKEPVQMYRMHKVMNYYLPTTLKLVEAYHDFDKVSTQGGEIVSAKQEIEATLDAINEAFVELLNNLFQDKVLDVTTDAQVLQTMLASEGLTKEMEFVKVD